MSDANTNPAPPVSAPAPAAPDPATLAPAAAQAELTRLQGDAAFTDALLGKKGFGPAYREATERWRALNKAAAAKGEPRTVATRTEAQATGVPSRGEADAPAAEKMLDAMSPLPSPEDYKIVRDYGIPDWDAGLEKIAKAFAHAAQLSQGDLDFVVSAWNQVAVKGAPTPEQVAAAYDSTAAALERKYGERAPKIIAAARSVIQGLPAEMRPQIEELLEVSGLCNSLPLVERLAMVAERRAAKRR